MHVLYRKTVAGTPFGDVHLLWSEFDSGPLITRIFLPGTKEWIPAGSKPGSCDMVLRLAHGIEDLLAGKPAQFSLDDLWMDGRTPFQRRVLTTEREIPRGRVSTYGLIASLLGNPRGARAVGAALSGNPFPLAIPCHRVVRSDGGLGGYQGGTEMKRRLLEMEGLGFDGRGRIVSGGFWPG